MTTTDRLRPIEKLYSKLNVSAPPNSAAAKVAGMVVRAFEALSIHGAPTLLGLLSRIPALNRETATVILPTGELLSFPAFDGYWGRYLWGNVPYERDVEQIFRKIGRNRVLLDCGANIGYWSIRGGELGFTRIIAVEANPKLIPFLRENFRLNGTEGVIHHAAVYSQSDVQLFLDHTDAHAQAGIGDQGVPVTSITIADMLAGLPADREVVAKLDVEGAEIPAIEGAGALDNIILVYEDFAKHGMNVTGYILQRGLVVFGVSPSGDYRRIENVAEALAFDSDTALRGGPSNLVACTPQRSTRLERELSGAQ